MIFFGFLKKLCKPFLDEESDEIFYTSNHYLFTHIGSPVSTYPITSINLSCPKSLHVHVFIYRNKFFKDIKVVQFIYVMKTCGIGKVKEWFQLLITDIFFEITR